MVMRYGMSERLGPLTFGGDGGPSFLRRNGAGWEGGEREYSEETARAIDEEVRRIIDLTDERVRPSSARRRTSSSARPRC